MNADPEPAVLTERRDRILIITLNRPDQRNAVNAAVAQGVAAALDELDGDAQLSLGVLDRRRQGLLLGHGSEGVREPASGRMCPGAASPASSSARPTSR